MFTKYPEGKSSNCGEALTTEMCLSCPFHFYSWYDSSKSNIFLIVFKIGCQFSGEYL